MVRSGSKQFNAYLNDMKTLDINLIKESSMQIIGKTQINEIGQLTVSNPIKGYHSIFDESQKKIGDIYVSIELEIPKELNSKKISDQSLLSDHSRPVTPASLANINVFHEKYEQFEKYQLKNQEFNPIITSLIQRAEKLKTDLNKSIYTDEYKNENFSLYNDFKGDSFNEYIDDNYDLDYTNEKLNNEPSYIFENNFDFHDKPEVEIEESEDK